MRQVKINIVCLETGEIKEHEGIYTLKQIYNILLNYERNEKFKIVSIEFGERSNGMFDYMPNSINR